MLFRKKILRSCQYCGYATPIDDAQVLCAKRGIVSINKNCRKFAYDPCKRIPPKVKASDFSKFDKEDFSL